MSYTPLTGYFDNKYFTEDELKCKGSGKLHLHPGFLGELVWLRQIFGKPMVVTSCCRSPEHNKKIGGHPHSLHLTSNPHRLTSGTMAIDIATPNDDYRNELIRVARELGWSIGYGKGFLHLDRRIGIGMPRTDFDY